MACVSDVKRSAGSLDAADKQNVRLLVQQVISLAGPRSIAPSSQRENQKKMEMSGPGCLIPCPKTLVCSAVPGDRTQGSWGGGAQLLTPSDSPLTSQVPGKSQHLTRG